MFLFGNFLDSTVKAIDKYKAPRHAMYKIKGISFSAHGAGGVAVVYDRETDVDLPNLDIKQGIGAFDHAIDGTNYYLPLDNHVTKYLQVCRSGATEIVCSYYVYGEIVKATTKELIIEWFRKR